VDTLSTQEGAGIVAHYSFDDAYTDLSIQYHIFSDGAIKVDYKLTPAFGLPDIPRVGLQFFLPEAFDRLKWFGRGPHESYADKKLAPPLANISSLLKRISFTTSALRKAAIKQMSIGWK
jgi:hypothetical protein